MLVDWLLRCCNVFLFVVVQLRKDTLCAIAQLPYQTSVACTMVSGVAVSKAVKPTFIKLCLAGKFYA